MVSPLAWTTKGMTKSIISPRKEKKDPELFQDQEQKEESQQDTWKYIIKTYYSKYIIKTLPH